MAKTDQRLGKGLGALLGEYDSDETAAPEREVLAARVRPNPFQPRDDFKDEALDDLTESIRQNGLLQPIVVRPAGEGFEIVAGERRFRAIQRLGWTNMPIVVRELSDRQMLVLALVENLQRESLSAIEEAMGYQQLIDEFGLTQEEVARQVGRDRSTVSNTLRLLGLPDQLRAMVATGRLSAGHGRALLGLEREAQQLALARAVLEGDLSVRATERRVKAMRERPSRSKPASPAPAGRQDPVARRAELVLERALGTQVRVASRADASGEIAIQFHDSEDFARLLHLLAGTGASEVLGE